jgi:adenine-specific DNA-methyltransferase
MKKFEPEETKSANILVENIERLKTLFPEAVTEGKIDIDVLKQLLGGTVDEREEKYGLNWHGKRRARQLALTPSIGTLRPCPEDSVDWNSTQNLMIEGDNLEVLKLLQKSYAGKVKLIYIDPPYNTGKDFVYPDDFQDNIKNYLELTGQVEGGRKISSNTEASGRFHTDWLNMMYPRLKLARNLLRDDGVIFINIDDNEVNNLRTMMNEIFGEENFVGNAVWQKAYTSNMTAEFISNTHDHILIFAKDANYAELGRFDRSEEQKAKFKNPDNDPRGPWKAENLSAGKFYAAGQFPITGPTGQIFMPPPGRYWRCNESQYKAWLTDNRITFGVSGDGRPMLKKFLSEVTEGLTPSSWWNHEVFGTNKEASIELKELFDGAACFQTPKPIKLLSRICALGTDDDSIVLDFFGGSGTTAHAVFANNTEDGSNRRFILVQLPESLDKNNKDQKLAAEVCDKLGKPLNIAELTKERLRRAGNRIRQENPMFAGDLGFRVFKLDTTNIRTWDPDRENLSQTLLDSVEHLKNDRSETDVLYELLLKLGLDLCVPMEQKTIAGKTVHSIGAGTLIVCFAPQISREEVEPLALGIVTWRKALAPAGESTVVFRDGAFADDVAKTNIAAILQQHGLENVRCL